MSEENYSYPIHKLFDDGKGTFVHRPISLALGGITGGVFMCQLIYDAKGFGKKVGEWFFKTNEKLREETTMSRRELESGRKSALEKGWIETKRIGTPPKTHYRLTKAFHEWCHKSEEDTEIQTAQNEQIKRYSVKTSRSNGTKRAVQTEQGVPYNYNNTNNNTSNKTSLSVCEQTDGVDVLVEVEKCLPKNQISKEQLMSRWNELAEKYCFKPHRIFNTAWEKYLVKANKIIGNFHKEGWQEFFRCVEEIMIVHQGMECVRYFNLGFALRPEKFQDILGENVSYPKHYDTDVIKRIIAGLKSKQEKLALQIQHFEAKGDKKMMMKKHKRWKTNREAISKWQEILIGESK